MKGPLILVVDDDPDILEAVCDILESEGYRVGRARNGVEALECIEAERPDLILLDLMMPVMDGAAFSRTFRARYPAARIPVVVITADANPDRAGEVGADGFLAKPFDIEALLAEVSARAGAPDAHRFSGGPPP